MEAIATTIRGRGMSPSRLTAIADRLEKDVAASAIPGATIMIGSHDRVIFDRTLGFRDVAEGDPLRPDAIWRIYSMTKPIVTAAAMVLVEGGIAVLRPARRRVHSSLRTTARGRRRGARCASAGGADNSGPHAPYGGPLVRLSWR